MTLTDKQLAFISQIFRISDWNAPGFDRLRVTHRKDNRIQVSWRYRIADSIPPFTISDNEDFMYVSRDDVITSLLSVAEALNNQFKIRL